MAFARCARQYVYRLPLLLILAVHSGVHAQTSGGDVRGKVFDPSGALITGASVALSSGSNTISTTRTSPSGAFNFEHVPAGIYTLTVEATGFTPFTKSDIQTLSGRTLDINVALSIAVQRQHVNVTDHNNAVSINPDQNMGAIVLNGDALDALSDDPDELKSELQALAGSAAGPNGGQIYIDGFTGGQIPPKSAIREIRINQNPFSAEFDRIGYGRIEILTKPGAQKFSGHITTLGNASALNTRNPLVTSQPSYYFYFFQGIVNGPLTKDASYSFNTYDFQKQDQNIVDAIDPGDTASTIREAVQSPTSFLFVNPRLDFQLGKNNTLSVRDSLVRQEQKNAGVGTLDLPEQAYDTTNLENTIQLSNTTVVNAHLINETHFQWRRIRNDQEAEYFTPTVTVQGAFTTGGNNSGIVQDHQDIFEVQNYSTTAIGDHTLRFGTRLRVYRDANYSTSGENGSYAFESLSQYFDRTPYLYTRTIVHNPLARILLFDASLFYQDDWKWKPNFELSYGLRFEGQNHIDNHANWAPRVSLAWAPGHPTKAPKTVLRAGYGWFYDRFTVPNSFSAVSGTPYLIQAIHDNGINQESYVVQNPTFYDPNTVTPPSTVINASAAVPTVYSLDPHFHAALDMQGGVGIDHQFRQNVTLNVTYLYTRGVHQYLTNNVTAPSFDPTDYMITGPVPAIYNYQFQSGGIYKQHQIIATAHASFRALAFNAVYTFNSAKSDTGGVNYFPSVAHDPGLDYGRATFARTDQFLLMATYKAPYHIVVAPILTAESGVPYNLTLGNDLTGNNQSNARPTYGVCGTADVIDTQFGCLDSDPSGKGERIIPYNLGTGPANWMVRLRVSKTIGLGPRIKGTTGSAAGFNAGSSVGGRGLSGGQSPVKFSAAVPRRYSLTLSGSAVNLFNTVNLAPPNGVLGSPLFGKSQAVAGDDFESPTPGNRSIILNATWNF